MTRNSLMAGKVRSSGAKQAQSRQRAIEQESEKQQKFRGSAKIDLDYLVFDEIRDREDDPENEHFLTESFQRYGCVPLDPMFHIPAVISNSDLEAAVTSCSISFESLLNPNPAKLPVLSFPQGFRLRCLLGKHRVEAARKCLSEEHRWWIVQLYSDSLSHNLRVTLARQSANERPLNQGEVFYHILRSRMLIDSASEDFWWTRLHSRNQRQQASRLLSRQNFRLALEALSDIRALFLDFRTGMIGVILRLKCDDEVLHGFRYVRDFWTSVIGSEKASLERIDYPSVKMLELRIPATSESDRDFLQPLFQSGKILRHFSPSERNEIWERLLRYRALIPSLYSFFENFKYLMVLADCLKKLVAPEYRQTVAEAFERAFQNGVPTNFDDTGQELRTSSKSGKLRCNMAYRKVILCAMQQLEVLRPGSVLAEAGESKVLSKPSSTAWHDFASLAERVGFRSPFITDILLKDPDRTTARQSLLLVRANVESMYTERELQPYIDEIAAVYARLRKDYDAIHEPILMCSGTGENLDRRCGCPYRRAYEESSKSLVLAYVHQPDPTGAGEPTPFFVRRDVYLFFWGQFDYVATLPRVQSPSASRIISHQDGLSHEAVYTHLNEEATGDYATNLTMPGQQDEIESPDMSSHYSRQDSIYTDITPQQDQDMVVASSTYEEATRIRFVQYESGVLELVHEEIIIDRNDANIERLATNYRRQGLVTLGMDFRTLAPSQCLRSALNDDSRTILLVTGTDWDRNVIHEIENKTRVMKRPASDELMDQRPRKFHVVED